jgi:hypothetical protein
MIKFFDERDKELDKYKVSEGKEMNLLDSWVSIEKV